MYRYIALFNHAQAHRDGDRAAVDASLRQIGLQLRQRAGHIDLYASDDTPVLDLPCGGALIGHVFRSATTPPWSTAHRCMRFPQHSGRGT